MAHDELVQLEFRSRAFDAPEREDYINDCCRGADAVCAWLIKEFRARGVKTCDEPDQEDWGWYFECGKDTLDHTLGVTYMGDDDGVQDWQANLTKNAGFFASLFNKKAKEISPQIATALRETLQRSDKIFDLQ